MLRNLRAGTIARKTLSATRPVVSAIKLASVHRFHAYPKTFRPIRVFSVSFVSFRTSPRVAKSACNISHCIRRLSSTIPDDPDLESELTFPEWVDVDILEEAAQAPWLPSVPDDHEERLRRAYVLLLFIVMYFRGPNAQGIERDEAVMQQLYTVVLSS